MEKDQITILENRGLVLIEGIEAKDFLQNIASNNIENVNKFNSIFSGIFTPQGKYLYEFFIIKNKEGYLLDCDILLKEDLINHLLKYKLRSKVEITDLSSFYVIGVISEEKFAEIQNEVGSKEKTIIYRESPFFLDPRNTLLGARILSSLEKLYLTIKKLNLKIIEKSNYLKQAHAQGIPIQGIKNLQDNLFGLESNFEELNEIDFKKGCYVGQENTARIKLKNKLSKRLLPIEIIEGELNQDDLIYNGEFEVGKVLINNKYPFALIKYLDDYFIKGIEFKCKNAKLKITKPDWIKD